MTEVSPAILDLGKWVEKTVEAVRRICNKKQAPCVAFSLMFFDPTASDEERWNHVIELGFDPHNPPSEEEQRKVKEMFEVIAAGCQRIMDDQEFDPTEEFGAKGTFH